MDTNSEDDLWGMSDEELETVYKEAKAQENSPETDLEADDVSEDIESEPSTEEPDEDVSVDDDDTEEDLEKEEEDGHDQTDTSESDHDSSDDSETDDEDDDNTDENEADNPDGEDAENEEESSDDTEKDEDEEQPVKEYSFRANGKDYEFSSDEIVDQFPKIFGKAMDYTKKMQTIKPWRKTIDAIEGANLSHDDVGLMIDVLKGDKEAITEVLKRTGTDTLELDTEADSGYVAKNYGRDESALAISDIVDEISGDDEYTTTQNILSKDWDDKSWETVTENPNMVRLLHEDVKSGMYETLQPLVNKLKVYDGGTKPDIEYYKEAAQQHFNKLAEQNAYTERQAATKQKRMDTQNADTEKQERVTKAKAQSSKRTATKKASAKRKAAAPTASVSKDRAVVDYLDESDEAFDDWYKRLQDSV